jgi:hypothetical protein
MTPAPNQGHPPEIPFKPGIGPPPGMGPPPGFPELPPEVLKHPMFPKFIQFFKNQTLVVNEIPKVEEIMSMLKMFHKGLEISFENVSIKVPPGRKDACNARLRCRELPATRTVIDSVSGRFP